MNSTRSARHRIVLLGVGHTNAHVLRMWRMGQRIKDTELLCISNYPNVTYSGMLPAVVAGDVPKSAMEIDLVRLVENSGARLIIDNVTGVDRTTKRIEFSERSSIEYDVLSIGAGSRPTFDHVETHEADFDRLIAIKPMQTFLDRLQTALANARDHERTVRIGIVGGGIASFEIVLCLAARWRKAKLENGSREDGIDAILARMQDIEFSVISADTDVVGGLIPSAANRLKKYLHQNNIVVHGNQRVSAVNGAEVRFSDGGVAEYDILIWATSARAPEILTSLDVEKDSRGFILTDATLQSISDPDIFAVGDSGTIKDSPTPKAGVYAVRQSPVLFKNLALRLKDLPLCHYLPQKGFLKLVNVGGQQAIGEYRGLSWSGHWAWKTKLNIDQKFMAMYQDYAPPMMEVASESSGIENSNEMRCLGCGGKVPSTILDQLIADANVSSRTSTDVLKGLEQADDAAILAPSAVPIAVTTDAFASPMNDPFLFGRVLTVHSLSDLYAMGARPFAALANVELPFGSQKGQNRLIREVMTGVQLELGKAKAQLIGGHTIEGPRLSAGLTCMGKQDQRVVPKQGIHNADVLVLTKPLGTGICLAALMRSVLPGEHYEALIETLCINNSIALELNSTFHLNAMTDVTGFGLLGHLREMLLPGQHATIQLQQIPVLPAVEGLVEQQIESTLAPSNQAAAIEFGLNGNLRHWKTRILFDPQSSGGLLIAIPREQSANMLNVLRDSGCVAAAIIGEVVTTEKPRSQITLI
ncbi:MAG: selenide, water dikinase SelD [Pirellulaceae bacterium]